MIRSPKSFTRRILILSAALFIGFSPAIPSAQADSTLSDEQRQEIEELIQDYIMQNPDVILQSVQSMQQEEEFAKEAQAKESLASMGAEIAGDPLAPSIGNPNASVTIVEFFDYRCGYCKRVYPAIKALLDDDKDIKLVFKEFPILGDESVYASNVAMAVWFKWPDRYADFHDAMMASKGALSSAKVMSIANNIGLDLGALKVAMEDERIDQAIKTNYDHAQALNINGTPAFIIGDTLVPGAIDIETMKQLVDQAREG